MNSIDKTYKKAVLPAQKRGSSAFIDTNILVYAIDHCDKRKQKVARTLLESLQQSTNPMLSTQVLMEFYNVATNKLKIEKLHARQLVESFSNMQVVTADTALIKRAIDTSILSQISFWDALIIAAAEQGGCSILYSEDLNSGQIINGVEAVNPFAE